MSIRIHWDTEATDTLNITLEGRWHWEEFDSALCAAAALIEERKRPAALILDLRRSQTTMPRRLPQAHALLAQANVFATLLLGSPDSAFRAAFLKAYASRVPQKPLLFAPTPDTAHAALAEYRMRYG